MNHTKKCVLVPFDKYERMVKSCHREMHTNASPMEIASAPIEINEDKLPLSVELKEEKLSEEDIVQYLPKSLRSGSQTLLRMIDKNPTLDWNNKGELTVDGRRIANSHITDLIKDALVQYKNFQPTGFHEFYSNLTNIPLTLIRNPHRRSLVQGGSGVIEQTSPSQVSPPPGVPDRNQHRSLIEFGKKRKRPIKTWSRKWEKL